MLPDAGETEPLGVEQTAFLEGKGGLTLGAPTGAAQGPQGVERWHVVPEYPSENSPMGQTPCCAAGQVQSRTSQHTARTGLGALGLGAAETAPPPPHIHSPQNCEPPSLASSQHQAQGSISQHSLQLGMAVGQSGQGYVCSWVCHLPVNPFRGTCSLAPPYWLGQNRDGESCYPQGAPKQVCVADGKVLGTLRLQGAPSSRALLAPCPLLCGPCPPRTCTLPH